MFFSKCILYKMLFQANLFADVIQIGKQSGKGGLFISIS